MENIAVDSGRVKNIIEELEARPEVAKVIMLCLAGSHAYGTSLPTSDVDIRGVVIGKPEFIRAPFRNFYECSIQSEEDGKVYELSNFMKLFCEMNPNVIELAFTDDEATLYQTEEWTTIKAEMPKLVNREVAKRFSGFAAEQLRRIKGHSKWINNPQPEKPYTQKEFFRLVHSFLNSPVGKLEDFQRKMDNMNDCCILIPYGNDVFAVVEEYDNPGMFKKDGSIRKVDYNVITDEQKNRKPLLIVKYMREDHRKAKEKRSNYFEWKKNRNPDRHVLEEKFGYDTKHAMHLVRILKMGEEILSGKGVLVRRPDAKALLDIREGFMSYDTLISWAESADWHISQYLYEHTALPKTSDKALAERLILAAQDSVWGK